MSLQNYNTVRSLVREIAHQIVPALRRAKRLHKALESRGVNADDWFQFIVQPIPRGYTLDPDNKVRDAQGNVLEDYSHERYLCDALYSAITGLRALAALLENDSAFLQRGVTGVDWLLFLEYFMDETEIGGL